MVFREVIMEASSPAALRPFYGDALDLPVVADGDGELAVRAGATTLRFRPAEPGTQPTYHFALRTPGNRFAEAKAWLAERAELVREDGRDEFDWHFWGARAVYALDPLRNVVELMAFPNLGPRDEGTFGPGSFVGVAELGLPVSDPSAAVARLGATFGIGLWDGEEVDPDALTPVGEQGATFLVTPIGRRWLFGDVAADHPLEAVLGGVREGVLDLPPHPYRFVGGA